MFALPPLKIRNLAVSGLDREVIDAERRRRGSGYQTTARRYPNFAMLILDIAASLFADRLYGICIEGHRSERRGYGNLCLSLISKLVEGRFRNIDRHFFRSGSGVDLDLQRPASGRQFLLSLLFRSSA